MNNLIINIRVLYWHLQVEDGWRNPRIKFNRYLWENGIGFRLASICEWRPFP
jgi:hypothetical protein